MRFFCLVNPVSGGKEGRLLISKLQEERNNGVFEGEIEETDLKALPAQLKRGYSFDRILIAGGDGTISNIICSLEETAPPVGILPLGTGNDLAKEIGVFKKFSLNHPTKIIEAYKTASPRPLTVWKLSYGSKYENSVKFINYISFGMDAGVVNTFAKMRASALFKLLSPLGIYGNRLGYFFAGFSHILSSLKLDTLKCERDGAEFIIIKKKCLSLIFANIRSVMGLGITNSKGSYFDDKLELITTNTVFDYLSMMLNLKGPFPKPTFLGEGTKWQISNLPINTSLQIDGEGRADIQSTAYLIEAAGKVNILTL